MESQAEVFAEQTEEVLRRAGLRSGMRVLDVGCGVGDVSLIAGRLVGPTGTVLGIDRVGDALNVARRRVAAANLTWVSFDEADISALVSEDEFDAVIGRFILVHLPDPGQALVGLQRFLAPRGVLAFLEMDISAASTTPPLPLFTQCIGWITQLYRRRGGDPDMGCRLYGTFRAIGFTPQLHGSVRVEGGSTATAYDYLAASIETLTTNLIELGIATAEEIGHDLAERLRAEAGASDACVVFPRLVGAWANMAERPNRVGTVAQSAAS